MNSDRREGAGQRRGSAVAGSALVALSVAVVFWVVEDVVVATILAIAVVLVALVALLGWGRGRECAEPTGPSRREVRGPDGAHRR